MNKVCRETIALTFVPELGSRRIISLMESFRDLEEVFSASDEALSGIFNEKFNGIDKIRSVRRSEEYLKELDYIESEGIKTVSYKDAHYPSQLRNIYDPPAVLFYKGELAGSDVNSVAIVGARRCSQYGFQMAEKLAYDLAERNITVISGMAKGIDLAAHQGALKAGGRTIAVMGSGFRNIYPEGAENLIESIAKNGAVLTEYSSGIEPFRYNFPNRNRIISGMAKGVVVAEAARKSGALITADFALEQGKEVFAVPGRADSYVARGSNKLIQSGAKLIIDVEDILEEIRIEDAPGNCPRRDEKEEDRVRPVPQNKDTTAPEEKNVMASIRKAHVVHINDMLEEMDMDISQLSEILVRLEIKGSIKALAGKRYSLK